MGYDKNLKLLINQIITDIGFDCNQYRESYLKRRLAIRMNVNNVNSYKDYALILKRNPQEYDRLLKAMTIGISEFFRDPPVFEVLRKNVLPNLIQDKERKKQKIIRIWSAGCASGEETYSIAILLNDFLGDNIKNFLIFIRGTDIDEESIAKAKKGEYISDRVKKVSEDVLNRYFIFEHGIYKVKDNIRKFVKFSRHDLISDKPLTHFDVVFCRNVAIYFSKDMHEKLYNNLYHALNNDGFLILGKTELLSSNINKSFNIINARERIFKKINKNY